MVGDREGGRFGNCDSGQKSQKGSPEAPPKMWEIVKIVEDPALNRRAHYFTLIILKTNVKIQQLSGAFFPFV